MGLLDQRGTLQLDLRGSHLIPHPFPSLNLVYRVHHIRKIPRVQGIPAESRKVLAKAHLRSSRRLQRPEGKAEGGEKDYRSEEVNTTG